MRRFSASQLARSTSNVQQKSSPASAGEDFANERNPYGFGEEDVVVVVEDDDESGLLTVVSVSVLLVVAGSFSFTIVVLFSVFFSAGGFVTVVSFCSQAPSRATLASKQMYLIINGRRI
jgi:hypothetical protein